MRKRRAISSVADVSLALVIIVACIALFAGFLASEESEHNPRAAAHTTETLGGSTFNVTYSLADILETDSEYIEESVEYGDDFERSTHATALGHIGRAALAELTFETADKPVRPLAVGDEYVETLENRLVVSLVGTNYETNVTAHWEPFAGASVSGTASFGPTPPPDAKTTLVRTTVASELPSARGAAVTVAKNGSQENGYGPVARLVADALINGTFVDAQRELEAGDVEHAVTLSRYLRFADAIEGVTRSYGEATETLARESVDTESMNQHLTEQLALRFESELASSFETPEAASTAVSTGQVTLSITTWRA